MTVSIAESDSRLQALTLAHDHLKSHEDVIVRAGAYHAFLFGAAAAASGTAEGGTRAGAVPSTVGGKAATADKAATAAPAKAAADKKAAAAAAAAAATTGGKAGAAGGKAGKAAANDAKAPGGKHTYGDVVNSLRDVLNKVSREAATKVLAENGNNVASVRDLDPRFYDAVVEGASAELGDESDPTAGPPADDLLG